MNVDNRIVIAGGTVVDPAEGIHEVMDLVIESGRIAEKGKGVAAGIPRASTTRWVQAGGKLVVPGLVDIHTHLREPGYEYKETIRTGTRAAVAGGFTSVVCMANTSPVNDNRSVTEYILRKAREEGVANVFPIGALTRGMKGGELAEIGELLEAGVVALSDDGNSVANPAMMRHALEYTRGFHLPIVSHCEDPVLAEGGVMNEGDVSVRLGLPGAPDVAEEMMVARDVALAGYTGARVHIAHISTLGSIALVRAAKARGFPVTAEATPHHFTLTDEAVHGYDTNTKMNPPLRTQADRDAVREGLRDGTIDAIATDHAPHDTAAKDVEYVAAANGIVGLETALGLTLALVHEGLFPLSRAIELLAIGPARALALPRGTLAVGAPADVTLIDPVVEWEVRREKLHSLSRNTPFHGRKLRGRAILTIVCGRVAFDLATEEG